MVKTSCFIMLSEILHLLNCFIFNQFFYNILKFDILVNNFFDYLFHLNTSLYLMYFFFIIT